MASFCAAHIPPYLCCIALKYLYVLGSHIRPMITLLLATLTHTQWAVIQKCTTAAFTHINDSNVGFKLRLNEYLSEIHFPLHAALCVWVIEQPSHPRTHSHIQTTAPPPGERHQCCSPLLLFLCGWKETEEVRGGHRERWLIWSQVNTYWFLCDGVEELYRPVMMKLPSCTSLTHSPEST